MKRLLVAAIVLGCSKGADATTPSRCEARLRCANEPTFPKEWIDDCRDLSADPRCGALYESFFGCLAREQVCDGSGKLDRFATDARCKTPFDAWAECAIGPTVDGGPDGDADGGSDGADDTTSDAPPDTELDAADGEPETG